MLPPGSLGVRCAHLQPEGPSAPLPAPRMRRSLEVLARRSPSRRVLSRPALPDLVPAGVTRPLVEVSFGVEYRDKTSVFQVGGQLDMASCPLLDRLISSAVRGDETKVILDLSRVEFIGAEGLRLLLGLAARVEREGGILSVRAPSPATRRMFTAGSVTFPVEDESATEAMLDDLLPMVEASAISEVVEAALGAVAAAAASLPGVHASSVTSLRDGQAVTVAASDPLSRLLDEVQYRSGGGPCVQASTTRQAVEIPDTRSETRWPNFVEAALAEGVVAVLSTPVGGADGPLGALNLYSRSSHLGPNGDSTAIAAAAGHILRIGGVAAPDSAASRLVAALESRQVIALAQGTVMALGGTGEAEAYAVLAGRARERGTTVRSEAAAMLQGAPGAGGEIADDV